METSDNKALVAKSVDTFSQEKERKATDYFANNTLLGGIEEVLKFGSTGKYLYPEVNELDAQVLSGYFSSFLKGLEKK